MAAALPQWSPQPVPATTPLGPAPDAGPRWPGSLRRQAAAIRASLRRDSRLDSGLAGGTPTPSARPAGQATAAAEMNPEMSGPAGLPPPPQSRRPSNHPFTWDEAEQRDGERLAAIAHELRTPLTSIMAMLRTVEQRGSQLGLGQVIDYARTGLQQATRLNNMIDQLLAGAEPRRATLQPDPAERELVDAADLARQAGHVASLTYPGRPIAVEVGGPLLVQVDSDQILEILDNLLGNAGKYTPPSTEIWVEARRVGRTAVLAVEDAGPGVPARERERIFEQFTRLDDGPLREPRGLGLGLTIARQLAHAQGGELVAVDPARPATGARFELRLPLAPRRRPRTGITGAVIPLP
jgi:signal transduction histidine kinase